VIIGAPITIFISTGKRIEMVLLEFIENVRCRAICGSHSFFFIYERRDEREKSWLIGNLEVWTGLWQRACTGSFIKRVAMMEPWWMYTINANLENMDLMTQI
jgi:hypothetical protein